ncbi:MAG: M81 family metallopeptidase [bacterium]|nr:M81 family metallopeptidase [Acidimicrobiia bacterium]MCY4648802.1 M81 family metallopeptidase [bacterium]
MSEAKPRIGIASVFQETNTFSPKPTGWEDFKVLEGREAMDALSSTYSEFSGAAAELVRLGAEPVPLLSAWSLPSGPVTEGTFDRLSELLDSSIKQAGGLDGLVLSLHGAMVSENHFDADSVLIETACLRVGQTPVGVCLDLHANLTARKVELADVMVTYHTEPHVDMGSTGERIARLVAATVRDEISPAMALAKRPLLIPAEGMRTDVGPMSEVRRIADQQTQGPVLDISISPVQPWLDVPELGLGVLVVTDDDRRGADRLAEQIADEVWRRRAEMTTPRLMAPPAAFATARRSGTRPFVMAHTADCPTAGATGDDPIMVSEAAAHGPDLVVMHTVLDPEAARRCLRSVGTRIRIQVGATLNPRAQPVTVDGVVTDAGAGRYRMAGRSHTGREVSMGEWGVITSGRHHLLVTSLPAITADPATWLHAGLDPDRADIVVVRSCSDYRANFPSAAPEAINLDLPGASTPKLESLHFEHAPRPLYPLDPVLT